jgi:hypothetical protein
MTLAEDCARYLPTEAWVISAGLGLVRLDDHVPAYAATMAAGHPDSVVRGAEGRGVRGKWWRRLTEWNGLANTLGPRRLADLDVSDGSTVIVCAGRTYVEAVAEDLVDLQDRMSHGRLLVLSSGVAPFGLEESWLSIPGQLRTRFGGSMVATGTRSCSSLVEQLAPLGDLRASTARELIARWVQESTPLPVFDRTRLSDLEVTRWIERDVASNPGSANKSASLRRLRDSGSACEQARFGRLFERVMEAGR